MEKINTKDIDKITELIKQLESIKKVEEKYPSYSPIPINIDSRIEKKKQELSNLQQQLTIETQIQSLNTEINELKLKLKQLNTSSNWFTNLFKGE